MRKLVAGLLLALSLTACSAGGDQSGTATTTTVVTETTSPPTTTIAADPKYLATLKREVLAFYQGTSREGTFNDTRFTGNHDRVEVITSLYAKKANRDPAMGICMSVLQAEHAPATAIIYSRGRATLAWYNQGDQTCTLSSRF